MYICMDLLKKRTMIQRIQTVFLFLAFLASVLTFFYPLASFWSENFNLLFYVSGIEKIHESSATFEVNTIPLMALWALMCLFSLVSIFLFRKRIIQMRMARFAVFIDVIFMAMLFFYYIPQMEEVTESTAQYLQDPGIYFPIAALLFLILAIRFIMKDERKVRSADRIR